MASAVAGKLRDRGVHWADYLLRGRPVLLAIDSRGELVKRVRLAEETDEGCARAFLCGLLDHYDPLPPPRPALRLVSESRVTPPRRRLYLPLLRR